MSGAPGAAVLAVDPPKPPAAKSIPGWKQLSKLLPYIARSKGQVVVGMLTLAAMGIVGTLQPLVFGVIMDSPLRQCPASRPPQPNVSAPGARADPGLCAFELPHAGHLLPHSDCHRRSQRGLLLLDPLDSDRPLPRYRIRSAQRLARSAAAYGARILCAQSHRRAHVARHQRLERRAHGSGPGNHV